MKFRSLTAIFLLFTLGYSTLAVAGYRTFLDPRSMSMGGTGVASSTKFNASFHNPALIAFNRGDKPDKIYISASLASREIYTNNLEEAVNRFKDEDAVDDFTEALNNELEPALRYQALMEELDQESFRIDDTAAFSLLVDTQPVTINFFTKRDIREMTVIRNNDRALIDQAIEDMRNGDEVDTGEITDPESRVENTYFEISEFGVTVATTDVIDYNMPISWGFTPKLFEIRGSHLATPIEDFDLTSPPEEQTSTGLLEWNFDIGFAMLLTDDFLQSELGLDGWWLEGEWIIGLVGMNIFPTDFTPFKPLRGTSDTYPGSKRAILPQYQIGIAHYRENFMVTMDLDLDENEVYDFEGLRRFLSFGGEYYWRDDFHLRAGVRFNLAQDDEAARDTTLYTMGFLYQLKGFSIEASAVANEFEAGGTVGFGLAF